MTPQDFIRKWKPVALTERATAHEHFIDLCRLFDHPTPIEDDPVGDHFTFEKGAPKTGGGEGWADVWKKGFFAWEYKKKKRDLGKALEQLTRYAAALENPPLHVVCDTHIFRIETRWTNEVPAVYEFELDDLAEPANLAHLRAVFYNPDELRSGRTRAKLTKEAADKFQTISDSLQHRNPDREAVAHFVNQLVFCFFADSVQLLPNGLWKKLLQATERKPDKAKAFLTRLFDDMAEGGDFDLESILAFNGGLFDRRPPLALQQAEIGLMFEAASLDWSLIDPTIYGTLFERFLDPDKRAQIGAHYTDAEKIMKIVEPVVLRPLRVEWETVKAKVEAIMSPVLEAASGGSRDARRELGRRFDTARAKAEVERDAFIGRLCGLRILDPACGSGNFLYLALQGVKDIEWRAILDCEALGLGMVVPRVGPEIMQGIEINPFAAELARTTIWIGDIQWRVKNAIHHHPRPVLRKLDSIECRDALLTPDDKGGFVEAQWPKADFIVGNPPFLGGKLLRRGLGDETVETLFRIYDGHVPAEADLVCYWFAKAWEAVEAGRVKRVGLVATNSIRGGANRKVLEPIAERNAIFEAWSDEPWTIDGAAVRVSLVCFGEAKGAYLEGASVNHINSDLTATASDLTRARVLGECAGTSFQGVTKGAPFEVARSVAVPWLQGPLNPNGAGNADVLRPIVSGGDIARSREASWVIDFTDCDEPAAALYEAPFQYALEFVKPVRSTNKRKLYRERWWQFSESRSGLRRALGEKARYIATPKVSRHRFFVWLPSIVIPDNLVIAIARDDDTFFGLLSSRFHEAWSLALGAWIGSGNDPTYTPTATFETFPFPEGLTPSIPAADYANDSGAQRVAAAAKKLDDLRRAWLSPPDLVDIVPEVTPTAAPGEAARRYPDRIVPKSAEAAVKLKERTLTNLYNQRPHWLADAHEALDRAAAAAYGWPEDIATDDALARLLALNLERAARAARGQ
jgi:type II restriction/modification system DNA methylase subunit YeeA